MPCMSKMPRYLISKFLHTTITEQSTALYVWKLVSYSLQGKILRLYQCLSVFRVSSSPIRSCKCHMFSDMIYCLKICFHHEYSYNTVQLTSSDNQLINLDEVLLWPDFTSMTPIDIGILHLLMSISSTDKQNKSRKSTLMQNKISACLIFAL